MSNTATKKRMIEEEIKKTLVQQLNLPAEKVTSSASFREDLGIDSLDVVELMFEIEQRFDVVIPDTDIINLVTVGDLINYLAEKSKKL